MIAISAVAEAGGETGEMAASNPGLIAMVLSHDRNLRFPLKCPK